MFNSRRHPAAQMRRAALIVAAVFAAAASCASASQSSIEGVWSFNGGTVIIAPDPGGQLIGTVASPTTFDACPHPDGQTIWTDMQAAGDGSYTGFHQWYHSSAQGCGP